MTALSLKTSEALNALGHYDRQDLIKTWVKSYGSQPLKGARNPTLIRGLAYHMQRRELGGLKPSVSRKLLKIAKADMISNPRTCGGDVPPTKKQALKPRTKLGAQLVREWNGRSYTVHVTDKGFVMGGITYGSLSAAAKAITGAHWSGPRFFGVGGLAEAGYGL